jgi:hypothetical protein
MRSPKLKTIPTFILLIGLFVYFLLPLLRTARYSAETSSYQKLSCDSVSKDFRTFVSELTTMGIMTSSTELERNTDCTTPDLPAKHFVTGSADRFSKAAFEKAVKIGLPESQKWSYRVRGDCLQLSKDSVFRIVSAKTKVFGTFGSLAVHDFVSSNC